MSNIRSSFGLSAGQIDSNLVDQDKEGHDSPSNNLSMSSFLNPTNHQKNSKKSTSSSLSPTSSASSSVSVNTKKDELSFNSKYEEYDDKAQHNLQQAPQDQRKSTVSSVSSTENYSPRSSIVSLATSQNNPASDASSSIEHFTSKLKDNYKGFHANKRPKGSANIPPLSHPIKPKFKKKSGSLLGKFIYSSRKDSETSNHSPVVSGFNDGESNYTHVSQKRRQSSLTTSNIPSVAGPLNNEQSVSSTGSFSSKHKFRIPSITLEHHHHHGSQSSESSKLPQLSQNSAQNIVSKPIEEKKITKEPTPFNLDMNLNEMQGIVKSVEGDEKDNKVLSSKNSKSTTNFIVNDPRKLDQRIPLRKSFSALAMTPSTISQDPKTGWRAPDSWDVKIDSLIESGEPDTISLSESENDTDEKGSQEDKEAAAALSSASGGSLSSIISNEDNEKARRGAHEHYRTTKAKKSEGPSEETRSSSSHLPVLYGSRQLSHVVATQSDPKNLTKGPNHIVRVFKEDNTFTTILCPLETTTAELLTIVQKNFFLESTTNYQISVYIGNCVKVLESFEKPLKVQMGLLMLSGYSDKDNLRIIGREDLSFICKFVVENIYLRSLTHEEETMISKDYVDINISSLNLKNIPIIFHQHTYEIEKLNVADNPSIYIPLDFIQACNNLTSIIFSRHGCSRFPMNFLEAKRLTYLDMEKNFLDEIPSKFSHLKYLTHLKLNSNQLSSLPKSFGKLQNLISLNLSSNYFNSYPEPINELVNLQDLDLSYNDLSYLPESISKLTKLSKLNLSTNKLSKALPEYLTKLVSLKRLDIRYNRISNVDVLASLPNLEVTYASKNNISTFSDKMESLRLLYFDRNPITNLEFENLLPMLTVLDLSKAKITSIPAEFISKIPNIEKLVLDKNHLVNLPNELCNLSKLAFLSLYGNNLQALPSTIGQLTSLQYLDVHSNNLQLLPDEIWNLKSLSVLNVSSNILTSFPKPPLSVAKRISSSVNFRSLSLSVKMTPLQSRRPSAQSVDSQPSPKTISEGTESEILEDSSSSSINVINASTSLADSLLVLTLADNRLNDDCFDSISFLVELKSLNLSYNDILEIPEGAVRRLNRLNELYLSGNELTTLPADDLESLKSLKLLFLNNNKLVSLPAELSKLTNLQHLDVGSNQLKYNISNWPYDWNWHWNKNLKYLNFSGNKRFEIKQSHVKNPDTGEDFDSLLVLKNLKVLGLIDVTLTTTSVPEQSLGMRIRTTASELDSIGYGVADSMGMRECVSSRDIFMQKFRGNEKEVLICSFDGKSGTPRHGHRIASVLKSMFVSSFTNELNKLKQDEDVKDAIRRTFLSLNKEINGVLAAKKSNSFALAPQMIQELADLNLKDDSNAGCAVTIVYIKDKMLYTANIGDIETLLSRSNGDHVLLTNRHDPTNRSEFERIRASGGYVSGDGALDGELSISRGVGFFNYLPHTHSGPDITEISLTTADDMIVIATRVLWEYISYELAVDVLRQEKDDPMLAAQKLRDYALCYGATDKITVIVITLGEQKSKKFSSNALYNNIGRVNDLFLNKKRRDRAQPGDSTLRRLEEEIEPPIGELSLVFTDIKNSTLLWDAYPVPMRSAIKIHNLIMRRQLRIVGGYEVKTEGDAFMVSFPSPTAALLWCFNVQQSLLTADWPSEILETDQCCEVTDSKGNIIFRGLSVRMGIHWGSPVCEPDIVTGRMDYFGPMVNRASRISAIADGGQIAVSSDFLDEIKTLYKIHDGIVKAETTLDEAYHGNVQAGEIIEREINAIEGNGCTYFDLGEKKLKGLETPEPITLAYPKKLELRFEIFQKSLLRDEESRDSTRVVGTLPIETVYGLRTVSLRLENICSSINGGITHGGFQRTPTEIISQKITGSYKEGDVIALLNHIVTRIENCVATLQLRQQMSYIKGNGCYIDFKHAKSITNIMQELSELIAIHQQLQCNLRNDRLEEVQ